MKTKESLLLAFSVCGVLGCGGAGPAGPAPEPVSTGGGERPAERRDGMEVTGLMGTIPDYLIHENLETRVYKFERCFLDREPAVEFLGGEIEFYFHIRFDGKVAWVYTRRSTVGDRETERCLLGVAAGTRFPEPRGGGEVEFAWGFERDPPERIRPPVAWSEERVNSAVRQNEGSVRDCLAGAREAVFQVTAYVSPGGQVMAAGAATADQQAAGSLDCVAEAVLGWAMPDPGSYPAKVTFGVP